MGLLSLDDIDTIKPDNKSVDFFSMLTDNCEGVIGKKLGDMAYDLTNLKRKQILHFCSEGRFSAHELLLFLLKLHSGFDVYIATWKVSETPARLLVKAKQSGLINDLYLLVERRMQLHSPSALQLIQQNSTFFGMEDIHAKVMVIDSKEFPITIVTSANMSDNRRTEVGVIDTHIEAAYFHKNWIKNHIEKCQKK